jgi:hypothetical protein
VPSKLIIVILAGGALFIVLLMVFLTRRYLRYERRLDRGDRRVKRVWKPFWMN